MEFARGLLVPVGVIEIQLGIVIVRADEQGLAARIERQQLVQGQDGAEAAEHSRTLHRPGGGVEAQRQAGGGKS